VWEHPELKNVLSRAVGLDAAHLSVDYADGELEVATSSADERRRLEHAGRARIADICCRIRPTGRRRHAWRMPAPKDAGSQDNCTALVLRIDTAGPTACATRIARAACRCRRGSSRAR
jgi:hypothetical protein